MIRIVLGCFLTIMSLNLSAQLQERDLKIGQYVRNVRFLSVKNYSGPNRDLFDFNGRAVILDFWNKGCAACIAGFPKLQKLQEEFKDSLQILLITNNSYEELAGLFKSSPVLRQTKLPIIMSDTILTSQMFRHNAVPYQVWIDQKGMVKAKTVGQSATQDNISKLIHGRPLEVITREYIDDFESEKVIGCPSLLTVNQDEYRTNIKYYTSDCSIVTQGEGFPAQYYSVILASIDNAGTMPVNGIDITNEKGEIIGRRYFNLTPADLIEEAYSRESYNKIVLHNSDKLANISPSFVNPSVLRNEYGFCYETIMPNYSLEKLYERLKQDLQNYFGIISKLAEQSVECFVLYVQDSSRLDLDDGLLSTESILEKTDEGFYFINTVFQSLCTRLSLYHQKPTDPLFIDETGIWYKRKLNLMLKTNTLRYNDPELHAELLRHGLAIRMETRKMPVLVISTIH